MLRRRVRVSSFSLCPRSLESVIHRRSSSRCALGTASAVQSPYPQQGHRSPGFLALQEVAGWSLESLGSGGVSEGWRALGKPSKACRGQWSPKSAWHTVKGRASWKAVGVLPGNHILCDGSGSRRWLRTMSGADVPSQSVGVVVCHTGMAGAPGG